MGIYILFMWVYIYMCVIKELIYKIFYCDSFYSSDDVSPSVSGQSSTKDGESGNESDNEELEEDDDDEQSSPVKEGEDNEDDDFQKLIQTLQDVIDDNSEFLYTRTLSKKLLLIAGHTGNYLELMEFSGPFYSENSLILSILACAGATFVHTQKWTHHKSKQTKYRDFSE